MAVNDLISLMAKPLLDYDKCLCELRCIAHAKVKEMLVKVLFTQHQLTAYYCTVWVLHNLANWTNAAQQSFPYWYVVNAQFGYLRNS